MFDLFDKAHNLNSYILFGQTESYNFISNIHRYDFSKKSNCEESPGKFQGYSHTHKSAYYMLAFNELAVLNVYQDVLWKVGNHIKKATWHNYKMSGCP